MALLVSAPLFAAGCSAQLDDEEAGALESELSVNEIVTKGTVLKVTASALNIRATASTSGTVVGKASSGETVTCATTSGTDGWVHIRTADGEVGWVFGKYVVRASGSNADPDTGVDPGPGTVTPAGGTCAPGRAVNVVSRYQKALHDVLAYAEGTRALSKDGYDIIFSGKVSGSCRVHPNQCIKFRKTCSTAAGRYQFLNGTWKSVAGTRALTTFEPENQERAVAYLIGTVRRVTIPQNRPLTATEFDNAMSKLSWEWASLPPGRYGQPKRSATELRTFYCSLAGC